MADKHGHFLVGQGGIIEYKDTGKILITHRSDNKDYMAGVWDYPSGRLHQFETPADGLKREMLEETGLEVEVIKPVRITHFFRGEECAENELVFIAYWCRSNTMEIELNDEATEFKWVTPEEALELVQLEGIKDDINAFIKNRFGE